MGRLPLEQFCQSALARDKWQWCQVGSVEMQKVEWIEHHPVVSTRFELLLEQREARDAVAAFRHNLAIDQSAFSWQFGDRVRDRGKFSGPVEALTREEFYPAAVQPGLDAVSVEFDLVQPVVAVRRLVTRRGETRCDECGQGAVRRSCQHIVLSALDFAWWLYCSGGRPLARCSLRFRSLRRFARPGSVAPPFFFWPVCNLVHGAAGACRNEIITTAIIVRGSALKLRLTLDLPPARVAFSPAPAYADHDRGAAEHL